MRIFIGAFLLVFIITSCVTKQTPYATITGRYTGDKDNKEIELSKVENGKKYKIASTAIGSNGYFGFIHEIDTPAVYVLNVVWDESHKPVKQDHDLKRFYLEAGTEIDIEATDGKYRLLKTNSKKNELLSAWNEQVDTVFSYSHGFRYCVADYETFFPALPEFVEKTKRFEQKINTGDRDFDELMKLLVETDMNCAALNFLFTPRAKHPDREIYPEYYDYILKQRAPVSERLLELPEGLKYVRLYAMFSVMSDAEKPKAGEWQKATLSKIPNDLLKGYYAVNSLRPYRKYNSEYLRFKEMVEPYMLNDYLKNELSEHEISIRKIEEGFLAVDFSGTDINGKIHKLSDYKGKVVYVDVWATWCGPCKAQIPHLKKLEKKYRDKPVVFMSISVDKEKNREKWKNYVISKELKGVQIMDGKAFESEVVKAYKVYSIPRFLIFDKEGRIVSTKAPRPSTGEVEKILDKLL
jgi:thiol-disulfide isomerase/thioredoxin